MTVLAFCGPIGSDFKGISEQCYSLLNQENILLIDSSTHTSTDSILSLIEKAQGDVIIFGPDIFLEDKLRSQFDIKVFLELDSDLCLSNYLRLSKSTASTLEEQLNYYVDKIKPLNEQISKSAQFADFRRPEGSANDVIIDLVINAQEKNLKNPKINHSNSLPKDMFWKSSGPGTNDKNLSGENLNPTSYI